MALIKFVGLEEHAWSPICIVDHMPKVIYNQVSPHEINQIYEKKLLDLYGSKIYEYKIFYKKI